MIIQRTYPELLVNALQRLMDKTPFTDFREGSIARALLEVQIEQLATFYSDLVYYYNQSFLGRATGPYLDEVAALVGCERLDGESDENYRYRIRNWVQASKTANQAAIDLAVRTTPGVRDYRLITYPRGAGSFDVIVLPQDKSQMNSVVAAVQAVLDATVARGISAYAVPPISRVIDMRLRVIGRGGAILPPDPVRAAIREYISNLSLGEEFVLTAMIAAVRNAVEQLYDLVIESMTVDGIPRLPGNIRAEPDETFVPGTITVY